MDGDGVLMAGTEADELASCKLLDYDVMRSILRRKRADGDADDVLEHFVRFCEHATPKFPYVKALCLHSENLTERGLRALLAFLKAGYVGGLDRLDITTGNMVRKADAELFSEILQSRSLKDLTKLKMLFKSVPDGIRTGFVCEALAKLLESGHMNKLESLHLKNCLWRSAIMHLARAFQSGHTKKLKFLELIDDDIGDPGAEALARALESGNLSSLEVLRLSSFRIDTKGASAIFLSLQLGKCPKISELDLDITSMGDAGAGALAKAFESGNLISLKVLRLRRQNIGTNGATAIFQSFQSGRCPKLQKLDLSDNSIGDAAAEALAKAFESGNLSSLEDLQLLHNGIGGEGGTAILQSFQSGKCPKISHLDISYNKYSNLGTFLLSALAKALESGHLSHLKIFEARSYFNGIETHFTPNPALKEIAHVLGYCPLPNLLQLNFSMDINTIPADVVDDLVNSYRTNPFLVVWGPWMDLSSQAAKELTNLRSRNLNRLEMMTRLQDEKDVPGKHGKVFICGDPGVGKTTLRKTMTKYAARQGTAHCCWSSRQQRQEPTRGIETASIKSKGVELVLWDLAGQHEYEVLHSAFLPDLNFADGEVTFFVIVCRASDVKSAGEQLQYWLKFISSNSEEGTSEEKKRRVFVIPNCFRGEKGEIRSHEDWSAILDGLQKKFSKFLNLHKEPCFMDVTRRTEVQAFKKKVLQEAQRVLQMRKMPQICLTIQEYGMKWVKGKEDYPVLTWNEYCGVVGFKFDEDKLAAVGFKFDEDKLAAAAEYLHNAGLIILSRRSDMPSNVEGPVSTSRTDQLSLVIVDPQWFCRNVVGNLLLPDYMRNQDEDGRRIFLDQESGSIPISVLNYRLLNVPLAKKDEAVVLLSHFGICYRLPNRADVIFVPDLITRTDLPGWTKATWTGDAGAWVMGFSLKVENDEEAFLPIAALRHLQVDLALDKDVGSKHDSAYLATRFAASFKYKDMFVLIEYSEQKQNRIDFLVRPLVSGTLARKEQPNVAQEFVTRVLCILGDRCRSAELQKHIVMPWSAIEGPQSIEARDVKVSAGELKKQVERNGELQKMQWIVGGVQVKQEDVLSDEDLLSFLGSISRRESRTKEAIPWLTCSNTTEPGSSMGKQYELGSSMGKYEMETVEANLSLETLDVSDPNLVKLCKALACRINMLERELCRRQDYVIEVQKDVQANLRELRADVKGSINNILESQKSLNFHIQNLRKFSEQEKEYCIPRFAFVTQKGSSRWLVTLGVLQQETLVLHFLCEASHETGTFHEVEGQEGIDVSILRDSIRKLIPGLVWTLKVAVVAAKIAGNVVLPGLGILFNDGPLNNLFEKLANMTPGAVESSNYLLGALDDAFKQSFSHSLGEATTMGKGVSEYVFGSELELKGYSQAAVRELLFDRMDAAERNRRLQLKRVHLEGIDSGGRMDIKWICDKCYRHYTARGMAHVF